KSKVQILYLSAMSIFPTACATQRISRENSRTLIGPNLTHLRYADTSRYSARLAILADRGETFSLNATLKGPFWRACIRSVAPEPRFVATSNGPSATGCDAKRIIGVRMHSFRALSGIRDVDAAGTEAQDLPIVGRIAIRNGERPA